MRLESFLGQIIGDIQVYFNRSSMDKFGHNGIDVGLIRAGWERLVKSHALSSVSPDEGFLNQVKCL